MEWEEKIKLNNRIYIYNNLVRVNKHAPFHRDTSRTINMSEYRTRAYWWRYSSCWGRNCRYLCPNRRLWRGIERGKRRNRKRIRIDRSGREFQPHNPIEPTWMFVHNRGESRCTELPSHFGWEVSLRTFESFLCLYLFVSSKLFNKTKFISLFKLPLFIFSFCFLVIITKKWIRQPINFTFLTYIARYLCAWI